MTESKIKLVAADVWAAIKQDFLLDKRTYECSVDRGIEPPSSNISSSSADSDSACCDLKLPVGAPKLLARIFRSEVERGAIQGELYSYLGSRYEALLEYKIRSVFPSSPSDGRGDLALFGSIDDCYPKLIIELKHWASFQGGPGDFWRDNTPIREIDRWASDTNQVKIPALWIGLFTEFDIERPGHSSFLKKFSSDPKVSHANYYSLLNYKTYRPQIIRALTRSSACSKCKAKHLSPSRLFDDFTKAAHASQAKRPEFDFGYAYVNQEVEISGDRYLGRLHAFAVWKNDTDSVNE